ncbi:hypothetical protein BC829DRAFT_407343 [Chytridium lagenaria]|nr:hypothetical protein BC829DRAFT_407343 [Chytridium lagenaria]
MCRLQIKGRWCHRNNFIRDREVLLAKSKPSRKKKGLGFINPGVAEFEVEFC